MVGPKNVSVPICTARMNLGVTKSSGNRQFSVPVPASFPNLYTYLQESFLYENKNLPIVEDIDCYSELRFSQTPWQ